MSFRSNFTRCRWDTGSADVWLHGNSDEGHRTPGTRLYVGVAAPREPAFEFAVHEVGIGRDWQVKVPLPEALMQDKTGTLWAVGVAIEPNKIPFMWAQSYKASSDIGQSGDPVRPDDPPGTDPVLT